MLTCEDILEDLMENIDTLHELGEFTPVMHISCQGSALWMMNELDVHMQHAIKHRSVGLITNSTTHMDKNRISDINEKLNNEVGPPIKPDEPPNLPQPVDPIK